jgi:hypothetical protein
VFFIKCYPVPVPTLAPEEKYNSIPNTSGVLLLSIKCYPVPVPTLSVAENIIKNPVIMRHRQSPTSDVRCLSALHQTLSSARPDIVRCSSPTRLVRFRCLFFASISRATEEDSAYSLQQ